MKFPPGTRIKTPTGRLARVMHYDEDGRVHFRYCGSDVVGPNEQGCFKSQLLTIDSYVPEPR